jgi:hypothetical protein
MHKNPSGRRLPDNLRIVNCARCRKVLVGASELVRYEGLPPYVRALWPPLMSGYLRGRPFCTMCYTITAAKAEVLR